MKLLLLLVTFLSLLTSSTKAQNGTLNGTVTDGETGEPVIGASVVLEGTTHGASTDIDGNYQFAAPAGEYTLICTFIGYEKTSKPASVVSGESTKYDIVLKVSAEELEEVQIVGKIDKTSTEALMVERKKADVMIQSIGASEMSVKGVSDVETALTKVSGVSKVGSKGIFVRGLGDRYNLAIMNGMPVPSTDPNMKVIPLTIFPSDIVQNLEISKTYTPNFYGDYAGALTDINIKEYPDEPFLNVSIKGGFNTQASFKDFRTYKNGDLEYLGFTGDGRQIPDDMLNRHFVPPSDVAPDFFSNSWTPETITAPPSLGVGVMGGNYYDIGAEGGLGFIALLDFENSYERRDGFYGAPHNAQGGQRIAYDGVEWEYDANTAAMLNVFYRFNLRHSISFNNLYVNEASNEVGEYQGRDNENRTVFSRRNTYVQNQLYVGQLLGRHLFGEYDRFGVDWGVSYANAQGDEPDRKQNIFNLAGNTSTLSRIPGENNRFYSDLNEDEIATKLGVKYGLGAFDATADRYRWTIEAGYQGKFKDREFDWYQMNLNKLTGSGSADLIDIDNPTPTINDFLASGDWQYQPYSGQDTEFTAKLDINSGYGMATIDVIPSKLTIGAGARVEVSEQKVTFKGRTDRLEDPFREVVYDETELLPAVNAKYTLKNEANIRFAASRTITRPGLREITPFLYQEIPGGAFVTGNPDLINGSNYNVDLKYEVFPNRDELLSIAVFGKRLDDPIEKIAISATETRYSFANIRQASVAGVEVELNKRLNNLFSKKSELLSHFILGFNATALYTRTDLRDTDTQNTEKERKLQGASPYLINADLGYESDYLGGDLNTIFTIAYNVFGDRIFATGQRGTSDIVERSYGTLDLIWQNTIRERFGVKISVKNLTNPTIRREQEFGEYIRYDADGNVIGVDDRIPFTFGTDPADWPDQQAIGVVATDKVGEFTRTVESFKRGINISIALSYSFK
ncbi:carboxypeptidase-like regulatory domain-containing protein [Limibacter armeniacum]|uniref:TonB-dependent receptor n=1 Tax=Limibacter armeniacum TaxID=466084 RepID=UPI002FE53EE6